MSKNNQQQTSEKTDVTKENRIEITKNKDVQFYVQRGLKLLQGGSGKKSQIYDTIYLYSVEGSIELAQSVSEVLRGKVEGLYYIIDAYPIYQNLQCHIEVLITLTRSQSVANNLPQVYREKPIPIDQVRESYTLKSSSQERVKSQKQIQGERGKSEKREENIKSILKDSRKVNFDDNKPGSVQQKRDDNNQQNKRNQNRDDHQQERDNQKGNRRDRVDDRDRNDRVDDRHNERVDDRGSNRRNRYQDNEEQRDNNNKGNNQKNRKDNHEEQDYEKKNPRTNEKVTDKKEGKQKQQKQDQSQSLYVPKDEHKETNSQRQRPQNELREYFGRGPK